KQDDASVPYLENGFYYYTRFEDGKDYPLYCRKPGSLNAKEEVILDVNVLAEGHGFYQVRGVKVTEGGRTLAFAADTVGRRTYTIYLKNLDTGKLYGDIIPAVTGFHTWANDDRTLFYVRQDPSTLRWYQIFSHQLGASPGDDELVYQEDDDTFSCYVFKTRSKRYLMIGSEQTLSSEYRYLDANQPGGKWTVFLPRQRDHEYHIDHRGDTFYIRTNHEATNFRLMSAPVAATGLESWEEVIPHREDVLLGGFELFRDHLVLSERKDGLVHLRIIRWDGKDEHYLDFGEPAYLAYVDENPSLDTQTLRFGYTSMTTPKSIYDYDMVSREKALLKQDEILGGFEAANYRTERLYATAQDGAKVPISLVYRKGFEKDGSRPLLLYGYGSYGNSMNATFNAPRVSLLDRGFVYAVAHIRGGQEMGRWWYEDGKLLKKKNTFTDFIDCAEHLVAEGYANPDLVFAQGGSAGGLLIGAIMNMRPDLFKGMVTRVPWVDVVTTMLDEDIPLTTSEYDEWGNPNDKASYEYMLSYSPYDQVSAQAYPHLLVTTGLHDSQVQYWEPAKWVAKLRALKTNDHRLLLKTDMEAGHGGASGRYKRYHDTALNYAFMLDLAGIGE
ncbi:MAG: S9 family peptidase, partial [Candidatus Neomarinimicrobiota bacterium]